jgi:hypothetical protein
MSKYRIVNTKFWSDNFVSNLDPLEKLLWLYFLTNPFTEISGIYEITLKQIAMDTGIDRDNIQKVLLPRLKKAGKIYYFDEGWVYIRNFVKHQKAFGNIKEGIEASRKRAPKAILDKITQIEDEKGLSRVESPLSRTRRPKNENENENENEKKKEIVLQAEPAEKASNEINKVIEVFYKFNPMIKFGNTSQRKAVDRMIKRLGFEKTLASAIVAIEIQGKPYSPTITSPIQLENKLGELIAFYKKQSNSPNKIRSL